MANHRSDQDADSTSVGSADPQVIQAVAVHVQDVVTALEANRSANRGAVLRITPPFSGRMRARIHVDSEGSYDGETPPIHIDPGTLVAEVPQYPTADETAADSEDVEAHRRRHTEALDAWRETVRERLRDETSLETTSGTVDVRVIALG